MQNGVDGEPTPGESYGRRLTSLAAVLGDRVAVHHAKPDGTVEDTTWAALEAEANHVAWNLSDLGVGEGDLVVIGLPSNRRHLSCTFGAWKLGATVLPLRHDLPPWERSKLLSLAAPRAVIADGWNDGEPGDPAATASDDIAADSGRTGPPPDAVARNSRLIASSGSTGRPKLIATSRPGITDKSHLTEVTEGLGQPVTLAVCPLYHTNGYLVGPAALLDGHRVVLLERFSAERAVELIERYRVTFTIMVPVMLMRIARLAIGREQMRSLQRLVYGGATIPDWVVDRWFEFIDPDRFMFTYGSSEGLGIIMCTGSEWLQHRGTTGRPIDCTLRIVDAEGRELPSGEVGEVRMRPLNDEEKFQYVGMATPRPDEAGFSSIGDMGYVDEDGYLYIVDRRQDLIITGGVNVFPAEVEAALSEHPDIADCVVLGVADPEWGHRVHAVVEPRPGSAPSAAELRTHCRARLAGYKVPKTVEFLARLPRTEAGKLNRTQLAADRASTSPSHADPGGNQHG